MQSVRDVRESSTRPVRRTVEYPSLRCPDLQLRLSETSGGALDINPQTTIRQTQYYFLPFYSATCLVTRLVNLQDQWLDSHALNAEPPFALIWHVSSASSFSMIPSSVSLSVFPCRHASSCGVRSSRRDKGRGLRAMDLRNFVNIVMLEVLGWLSASFTTIIKKARRAKYASFSAECRLVNRISSILSSFSKLYQ